MSNVNGESCVSDDLYKDLETKTMQKGLVSMQAEWQKCLKDFIK